jgi:MFS family permease
VILLVAQVGQAILYGTVAVLLPPFPVLIALVAAAATLATLAGPAGPSVVPRLVPEEELLKANSWMGSALALQGTLGSAIGGFLVAVIGTRGALAANAISFALSAAFLIGLPPLRARPVEKERRALLADAWEGLRYAAHQPLARAIIVGLGVGVLFASLDDVALVFLARVELGAGAVGFGMLSAAYGLGFLVATVSLARGRAERAALAFMLGLVLMGVGDLVTGLAPLLAIGIIAQGIAGSGNGLEAVASHTLIQREIPVTHRGRVFGIVGMTTLVGAGIARGLGGLIVNATSARTTFIIAGVGVLGVTVAAGGLLQVAGRRKDEEPYLDDAV